LPGPALASVLAAGLAELGPVLVDCVVSVVVEAIASLRVLAELGYRHRLGAALDLLADAIDVGEGVRTGDFAAASGSDQTEEKKRRTPAGTR
jgi:hypothetical protein